MAETVRKSEVRCTKSASAASYKKNLCTLESSCGKQLEALSLIRAFATIRVIIPGFKIISMPSLFMTLVGATPKTRNTEQHDVFFGIADSVAELVPDLISFWPEAADRI